MKNEANTDALKAMVTENSIDSDGAPVTPTSPTTPVSPVSPRTPPSAAKHTCNHLHTIGGIGGQKNICSRCNHKKWPLMRRGSNKKMDRRSHIGEVTVLSVGRFRVTKSDPRPPVRRTLLITEPNGSVPASPGKTEAAALSSNTPAQPQEWFEKPDGEFKGLPWPPNSPDLNPIQHLRTGPIKSDLAEAPASASSIVN
ncbi:hypothetical protein NFI96_031533 [Prochilodus magdalenae]|nr:hypothetical protein NFI96_031533 [Prochilodus magdalenae]